MAPLVTRAGFAAAASLEPGCRFGDRPATGGTNHSSLTGPNQIQTPKDQLGLPQVGRTEPIRRWQPLSSKNPAGSGGGGEVGVTDFRARVNRTLSLSTSGLQPSARLFSTPRLA